MDAKLEAVKEDQEIQMRKPSNIRVDWPSDIHKPTLPAGYRWVCLEQTATGRWWIRVAWSFTQPGGRRRTEFISPRHPRFFKSPSEAIDAALLSISEHQSSRMRSIGQPAEIHADQVA